MDFKRGDTFDYSGSVEVQDAEGSSVDLTGWSVASEIKFPDSGQIETFSASWLAPGLVRVRSLASTASWPLGVALVDVQFVSPDGHVVSTQTARFNVVEDVTRGP